MNQQISVRHGERGGARGKFIAFMVVIIVIGYGSYLYIPVRVRAYQFKDTMQNKVDMAVALGHDSNWLRDQIVKSGVEYNVPPDAVITPTANEGRLEVRVQFTWPIALPGYTYQYQFDETAKSATFLTVK
jgi:hypothetical protein